MIEVEKGRCTISRHLDIGVLEWQLLMKMKSLWASHGCTMDNPGCYKYTFECKEEMPSQEELKEANELLDRVRLRLLDLNRIITVAKHVVRHEIERELSELRMQMNFARADSLKEVTVLSKRISDLERKQPRLRDQIGERFSLRVEHALSRRKDSGFADKPVEELTDEELLSIRNLGPKALAEIRQIIPVPKDESGQQ